MIKRIVIGSNNPAKLNEWKKLLGSNIVVKRIGEIGNFPEPEETGKTFAENARLKASYYSKLSKEYVLADDAGFEVDALNGEPGVKSRRILPGGKEGTDAECVDYILKRMKGISQKDRTARLTVYIAISDPEGKIIYEDHGDRPGFVTKKLEAPILPGFPYRSIMFIPEAGKTYAELSDAEHERLNHRKKVAERIKKFLKV